MNSVVRTRVKICGITRVEDALIAAELGADGIGLVFYRDSKRNVSISQAQAIAEQLPPFVSIVGLFVNPELDEVRDIMDRVRLDCLQFHGDEPADFCDAFDLPCMKALRVRQGVDTLAKTRDYSNTSAILLDSYHKSLAGGSGITFDWAVARQCVAESGARIVLAGGLSPDNVAGAIAQVRPYAVDVSSGVEQEPGIKDPGKMQAFFNEVVSSVQSR